MRNLFWILFIIISTSLSAQMEIDGEVLYGNEWIEYDKTYLKITVDKDGIYRVTKDELISSGLPIAQVNLRNLVLYNYGKSVPFFVSPNDAYIEFFGNRNRSELDQFIYLNQESILNPEYSVVSDKSAYFLSYDEVENPLLISQVTTDLSANSRQPESYYMHQELVIENQINYKPVEDTEQVRYSNFVASEGFGSGLRNANVVNVPLSNVVDNGVNAAVQVRFGGNRTSVHNTQVSINGDLVESVSHSVNNVIQKQYEITSEELGSSNLQLELKGSASGSDKNIIAYTKVSYPREFVLEDDTSFMFHIAASNSIRYIEIEGYEIADLPVIYDLEANQRIIPERTSEDKIGFLLSPSASEKRIFLTSTQHGINEPLAVTARNFIDYNDPDYNYIMISNEELRNQDNTDWVQEYADYRASNLGGSYVPVIANVDQLYDQYAYGIDRHFIAFRNFGYWTKKNYTNPEFMFIIGKGREYSVNRTQEQIENNVDAFIPTWGNPGSDNMILASDTLPLPIYPIGRLAAKNAEEIKEYLDKVKVHDENLGLPQTIEDRLWQKKVLHLSGGDAKLQEILAKNLEVMGDTLTNNDFGADVTTFYKKSIEAIEVATSDQIFNLINNGLSIITFFGHSSVGKFDFSIDNIDKYENKGKYPLVFSLGCYSGNIHTEIEGISEQFIVAEDKGAICFIAASGTAYVGQQYEYGVSYYQRLGGEDYGKPIGTVLNNVIREYSTKSSYSYITFLQQLTLHGDPAVRLASFESADVLPDASSIRTIPTFVDTYEDDFEICFDVANIGKHTRGEYDILIEHFDPTGQLVTDSIIRREVPKYLEEYCLKLPINSNTLVGKNLIKITVDASDDLIELPSPDGELNNKLISNGGVEGFEFYILNNSAIPTYPKEFSIVNETDISLVASTYNALGDEQRFIIQIDSTQQFNSPLLQESVISDVKGIVEWKLDFPMNPKTVYYWRISPDSTTTGVGFVWNESSFVYDLDARDGWNQSHYFQYLDNDYENMSLKGDKKFYFATNLKEILIANRVWEPGLPAQFIIDNGFWGEAMNRGTAPSIGVTVIDTLGKFYKNGVGGEHGSLNPYTVPIITHYFKTDNQQSRIDLINFMENIIPEKYYVCVYNVYNNITTDFKVEDWAADSLANEGVNIFNYLEDQGSLDIRRIQETGVSLPFGFIYQKGVSPLAEGMADDINGDVEVKEALPGFWFEGSFTSDFIGPSRAWNEVEWSLNEESVMSSDSAYVRIYGFDSSKENETLLYDKIEDKNIDISNIDTEVYPYLKVEFYANDLQDVSPVQISALRVYYEGYGDIAVNTTQNYSFYSDSLQQGDNLKVVYDITNFTSKTVPPSKAEYRIIDTKNNVIVESRDIPELKGRESKTINFEYDTRALLGQYQFQLEVNTAQNPMEEYYFNNIGFGGFKVTPDKINPLLDVAFDGVVIMDQDIVSSNPLITIELLDENPFILLEDPENFTVLLQFPSGDVRQVNIDDPKLEFYPAVEGEKNKARIEYNPELTEDGEYTLTIEARDESNNNSGDKNYEVRFRVFNEEMVSNVFNYPNPFSTSTQFIFTLTGNESPANVLIRIMTLSGKVVREITSAELGSLHIGMNKTEFKWDGRDEFGDKLGNGTYLYQVITKKMDGSDYKHFSDPTQNNTDHLFNEGFGKLVIIR